MSADVNTARLAEITARLAAATPGPWRAKAGSHCVHVIAEDGGFQTGCITFDGRGVANAAFVAHAPADLAYLLAEVARLNRVITWAHERLDAAGVTDRARVRGLHQTREMPITLTERIGALAERARIAETWLARAQTLLDTEAVADLWTDAQETLQADGSDGCEITKAERALAVGAIAFVEALRATVGTTRHTETTGGPDGSGEGAPAPVGGGVGTEAGPTPGGRIPEEGATHG